MPLYAPMRRSPDQSPEPTPRQGRVDSAPPDKGEPPNLYMGLPETRMRQTETSEIEPTRRTHGAHAGSRGRYARLCVPLRLPPTVRSVFADPRTRKRRDGR